MENNWTPFYGAISVKAILEGNRRDVKDLYVDRSKRSRDFAYIIALAKKAGIPVHTITKEEMRIRYGQNNGSIVCEAGRRWFADVVKYQDPQGLVVYLCGLEDPYNLGSTIRSLYAAGVQGVILQRRDWYRAASTIVKASAGAWEKMDIYMVENDESLLAWCRRQDLPITTASRKDAVPLFEYQFPKRSLLVIGGALRGISAAILEAAKDAVYIPYGRDFRNALDTPSAAAVMAFAWTAQQKSWKEEASRENDAGLF